MLVLLRQVFLFVLTVSGVHVLLRFFFFVLGCRVPVLSITHGKARLPIRQFCVEWDVKPC